MLKKMEKWKILHARATAAEFEGQSSRHLTVVHSREQYRLYVYKSLELVENVVMASISDWGIVPGKKCLGRPLAKKKLPTPHVGLQGSSSKKRKIAQVHGSPKRKVTSVTIPCSKEKVKASRGGQNIPCNVEKVLLVDSIRVKLFQQQ